MNDSLKYNACTECGFDHSYEPEEAERAHAAKSKRRTKVTREIYKGEETIILTCFPSKVSMDVEEARQVAKKILELTGGSD